MPIPFILAGLGVAAGAVGVGGHIDAKKTNEEAQRISIKAQNLYDEAKSSLEKSQDKTENALLNLGYLKKHVLETSIKDFFKVYDRIKNIQLSESKGLNELSDFIISNKETIELRRMSDIYESTFSSGVTGAAAGAVIALAASGSLPVVTGVLSTAGTALAIGEFGMATSLAGSALSFGMAMTPLSAIAAPAILFTGISSSIKADENLEKANTMLSEAQVAVEKMKTSETLCSGITEQARMFGNLLSKLNRMFSKCTILLDNITCEKMRLYEGKRINANDFTQEELNLIAVTRSLAGAVKAVIDISILNEDGSISQKSKDLYDNTQKKLPVFNNVVNQLSN